ncbi:MAG: cob(I)yrinic acid a,c-diamide adenosyltransferase [Lachnospiraceae bacterium]|nr:cob(I)yrinic acid a,c-diamide adenosyltransferase [Lachnospiraceae bacterium]
MNMRWKDMENVHIIYGAGYGKTAAAMGLAVKAAGAGETVTIVQFLKGTDADYSILSQFDEINFFTFENSEKPYGQLTFEEREEQRAKAKNSFHYAKKVIDTGSADVVILDEVLGLLDYNILFEEEIAELLRTSSKVNLILTGRNCPDALKKKASMLSRIEAS